MEWLNLHTSILDSAEVIGADPTERAAWLMLLRYCIGQENGGIIQDCREWKDRKWQQLIRITKAEAMHPCDLYTWHGNDLHVTHYPTGKEQEIKRLRDIGRISTPAKKASAKANGTLGGRPPKNPTETQQETQHTTEQSPEQETHTKPIERKGREEERKGKGKEAEEEAAAADESQKIITAEMLRDAYPRKTHLADTLREAAACMRRHDPQKILDGTLAIAAAVSRWTESERMTYLKKPSEFFAGDHWADDPAHWRGRHDRTTATQTDLPSLGGRKPASHILI